MMYFKVSEAVARLGKEKGKKVFYARRAHVTRLKAKAVEDLIVEKTSLSRGDVRHAIVSLAEVVRWATAQGMAVDLADLGSFKVNATGHYKTDVKEVTVSTLKRPRLTFYPRRDLLAAVHAAPMTVENPKAHKPITKTPKEETPQQGGSGGSGDGHGGF